MTSYFTTKKIGGAALKSKKSGFTIVETLVAVTVLMIAIAGPLVVASKGLTSALYSKDQMIASYLAQESMETIKNIKNNNEERGLSWLDNIEFCDEETICDASAIDGVRGGESEGDDGCGLPGCRLFYSPNDGYNNTDSGNATHFFRHFYLQHVTPYEVTVHVFVDWNEGTVPYQMHMASELVESID